MIRVRHAAAALLLVATAGCEREDTASPAVATTATAGASVAASTAPQPTAPTATDMPAPSRCEQVELERLGASAIEPAALRLVDDSGDAGTGSYSCDWSDGEMAIRASHGPTSGLNTPMSILMNWEASADRDLTEWIAGDTIVFVTPDTPPPAGGAWDLDEPIESVTYVRIAAGDPPWQATWLEYSRPDGAATGTELLDLVGIVHLG